LLEHAPNIPDISPHDCSVIGLLKTAKEDRRFGSNETARLEWGNGFNYNPTCCLWREAIDWRSHGTLA